MLILTHSYPCTPVSQAHTAPYPGQPPRAVHLDAAWNVFRATKNAPNVTAAGDIQIHFIDGETEAPVGLNSDAVVRPFDD